MTRENIPTEQLINKHRHHKRHDWMVEQHQSEKLTPGDTKKITDHRTSRSWISKPEDLGDKCLIQPKQHSEKIQLTRRRLFPEKRHVQQEDCMPQV